VKVLCEHYAYRNSFGSGMVTKTQWTGAAEFDESCSWNSDDLSGRGVLQQQRDDHGCHC
jgi:hypothetical protein